VDSGYFVDKLGYV